ncbi:YtxH domain-containing protein [Naasia sp. SYSU D00948]|uniref:YtxH domain-containing protein n=1 Tax=Naasia sp. SYSU D00948 TaxID=2817379 RepID=UPI001B30DDF4|nr:YtxH domain-containing protein [Naasia sp. SYSU D00948]
MKNKLVFVTGAAVGYVLGARAGRKRYEQIKAGADKFWNSPAVQKRVEQVQGFVDDHAPDVQSKVTDAGKKVVDQVTKRTTQRFSQKGSSSSGSSGGTGATGAAGGTGAAGDGGITSGNTTTGTTASGTTIPGASQPGAGDRPPFE